MHVHYQCVEVLVLGLLGELLAPDQGVGIADVQLVIDEQHLFVRRHGPKDAGHDRVAGVNRHIPRPLRRDATGQRLTREHVDRRIEGRVHKDGVLSELALRTHPQLIDPQGTPPADVLGLLFLVDVRVVQESEGKLLDGGLLQALLHLLVGPLAQTKQRVVLGMGHRTPQQAAFTVCQACLHLPHPRGVRYIFVQVYQICLKTLGRLTLRREEVDRPPSGENHTLAVAGVLQDPGDFLYEAIGH